MKINFTKKEYRLLISMLEIAEWVMSSHDTEKIERKKPYEELEQKVLSFSKEMDCEDWVEYSKELEAYYPTREFEDSEYRDFIDEYDEQNFWDSLQGKLATRDLYEKYPSDKLEAMGQDKQFMKTMEIEDQYAEELYENGLKNFRLIEPMEKKT